MPKILEPGKIKTKVRMYVAENPGSAVDEVALACGISVRQVHTAICSKWDRNPYIRREYSSCGVLKLHPTQRLHTLIERKKKGIY